jgi:hypothetical protein
MSGRGSRLPNSDQRKELELHSLKSLRPPVLEISEGFPKTKRSRFLRFALPEAMETVKSGRRTYLADHGIEIEICVHLVGQADAIEVDRQALVGANRSLRRRTPLYRRINDRQRHAGHLSHTCDGRRPPRVWQSFGLAARNCRSASHMTSALLQSIPSRAESSWRSTSGVC